MNKIQKILQISEKYLVEKHLVFPVVENPKFAVWSGSSKPHQHHYGKGGLITHTLEVIELCMSNYELMKNTYGDMHSNPDQYFLAALYHDVGKMWDYSPVDQEMTQWTGNTHKRNIHHISRSCIVWNLIASQNGVHQLYTDEISHAILAHHGLREWGSPVAPNSKVAWMLHLCDGISARINDCNSFDCIVEKK